MAHPSLSCCGVTSLSSGNAPIGKRDVFRALFLSRLHARCCRDAVLPLPARSDRGPGATCSAIRHSRSTADVWDSQKPGNSPASLAALPPARLHVTGCMSPCWVAGGGSPFFEQGCSRAHPRRGGRGQGAAPSGGAVLGGVSGKRFHNPCLCAVRQHAHRDFTSAPFPLSQR